MTFPSRVTIKERPKNQIEHDLAVHLALEVNNLFGRHVDVMNEAGMSKEACFGIVLSILSKEMVATEIYLKAPGLAVKFIRATMTLMKDKAK